MSEKIKFRDRLSALRDKLNTPFVQRVGNKLISKKHLYPAFGFPVVLLLIVYAAIGVYPFGERSILTLDMGAQYLLYFEQIRDVLTGEASLIYTFERTLGGEFLGYYGYYLASPLSWIVCLFPARMIIEAITTIMLLKCGLSGFFFAYYIEKTRKTKDHVSLSVFACMYALCSYAMAYQSNIMWMDVLMLLPLVTLGLERLITEGKFTLFTISFALAVWSNFYIGYMCCFYVLFYTICFLCAYDNSEINALNEKLHKLKSVFRVGICSAISLMMCAMTILTSYYALSFGKNEFQTTTFTFDLRFTLLELFSKFFFGTYDTVRPDGTPNIYCGILILLLVPTYFLSKKFSARHKISYFGLCCVFIASFSVNAIDLVWHGFQMPVWLNYRYSFMFVFVVLILAYRGLESISEQDSKFYFKLGAFLIFALMVMEEVITITRYKNGNGSEKMPSYEFIWVSAFFIVLYVIAIYFLKHQKAGAKAASTFLLVVALVEAGAGAGASWGHEVYEVGYGYRNEYVDFIDRYKPVIKQIKENDPSFYRMEKTPYQKNNENLALDINGITASTSTLNAKVIELLHNMGFAANSHWAKYFSGNEVADTLLGMKYIISEHGTNMSSLYNYTEAENGVLIYENPYALSIAYAADVKAKSLIFRYPERNSPFNYLEGMISNLSGSSYPMDIFENCAYRNIDMVNCTKNFSDGKIHYTTIDPNQPSSFTYRVKVYRSGSVYMNLLYSWSETATYYVNGEWRGTVLDTDPDRIHNIGYFNKGDVIEVKFEFQGNRYGGSASFSNSASMFTQLNPDEFEKAAATLAEGNLKITDYSDTRIEGTITAKENQYVFTTIPYDKYWRVYVDGERVETFTTMETLLSFDIEAGEHEIVMKYVSEPFYIGIGIGALGIGLLVALIFLDKKKGIKIIPVNFPAKYPDMFPFNYFKKKKKGAEERAEENPEGEQPSDITEAIGQESAEENAAVDMNTGVAPAEATAEQSSAEPDTDAASTEVSDTNEEK